MKSRKNFLVIGNPIKHSLSPFLHNYWFRKNKINCEYKKFKTTQTAIKKILKIQHFINNIFNRITNTIFVKINI